MGTKTLRFLSFLICFSLIVGGCSSGETPTGDTPSDVGSAPGQADGTAVPKAGDSLFTLSCSPDDGFDPFSCRSGDNLVIISLMYEGLFRLTPDLQAENVLCSSWKTEDGLLYEFTIKSGVYFHDGTLLTAQDAADSLHLARSSPNYSERLRNVTSVYASGENAITVTLSEANYRFPSLLDIPIAKLSETGEVLCGTGPYLMDGEKLTAFESYRARSLLPLDTIYLSACSGSELTEAFSSYLIDLIHADPSSESYPQIPVDYETRNYDSTVLQYIGFNCANPILANADVRRAISHAVDRSAICSEIYSGSARPAPLILPSLLPDYNAALEEGTEFSLRSLSEILASLGVADEDGDSYLEYPVEGVFQDFPIRFIVNEDNPLRVLAAEKTADTLKYIGLDVKFEVLPWEDYVLALENGEFDMYCAETRLSADFDLSEILCFGGSIAYGVTEETDGSYYVYDYISAPTEVSQARTAELLCEFVRDNATVIPILYRQYSVITHRNVISDIRLSQTGIFCGITELKFNLGQGE